MISRKEILDAQAAIRGQVYRTPLLSCKALDEAVGIPVLLKPENFQEIGAFKIRGASNWLAQAQRAGRKLPGVLTYSSGNHGQAVACAAKRRGLPAIIVVPEDAPAVKLDGMRRFGAQIVVCGRTSEDRRKRAEEIQKESGFAMIPPFDDPWIVAGQGTAALEILEDRPDMASLIAPVGGAGLLAGCALAAKSTRPGIQVFGVEPVAADALAQSLEAKRIVKIHPGDTIADGLRPSAPGELNFELCSRFVDRVVRVSDEEIGQAVVFLLQKAKLLVEPSGAAGVAALLSKKLAPQGPCAVILSGGNIEPTVLQLVLRHP